MFGTKADDGKGFSWTDGTMRTVLGGERVVDMLVGEQLPRIC